MEALFSYREYKKDIGIALLFVMFLELLIGGVILPYQQNQRAQAVVDVIGGPVAWPKWATDIAANVVKIAKQAYAAAAGWVSAGVALWEKSNVILKEALIFAWNRLRRILLNMLVNDIIAWIQGGGKPRFVTNWQSFLQNAADKAAGQLIDRMGGGFLCNKFSFQLRLALSSPPTFDESSTCTLSAAIANVENFMTDFSKGGWKGWIKISESQNNYMGAYFMALDKKYAVMSDAANASKSEGESSSGFLGDKVCTKRQCPNRSTGAAGPTENYSGSSLGWKPDELDQGEGNSCECLNWTTRTPGRQVGDALQQATGIDIPWLISAKEFAEYAGAIVDAVINRAIKEGIASMTSSSDGTSASYGVSGAAPAPGINSPATVSVNLSAYDEASENGAEIEGLAEQQSLLQENSNKLIEEEQKTLTVLNNIKTSQSNSLNTLVSLLQSCALPSGASVVSMPSPSPVVTPCTNTNTSDTNCTCVATTIENVKLSASGVGEAILEKTTTQNYGLETDFPYSCVSAGTSISYRPLSTTVAIENEITNTNTTINSLRDEITKNTTANTDTLDYQASAANYMTVYEAWQKGDLTAATSTAETAMNTAKQKAIASNQVAIPATSVKFKDFTKQVMEKSNLIVEKASDSMTKRGAIAGCSYASISPPCFQVDLCNAQSTETTYQSALNTCLNPPY